MMLHLWRRGCFLLLVITVFSFFPLFLSASISINTISCDGHKVRTTYLPFYGKNFRTYCIVCVFALRTFAREEVIETLLASYDELADQFPQTVFVYGEMGFPWGGHFWPHRTHRNGLSADLMVSLKGGKTIKTTLFNRFGYDVEFDRQGLAKDGNIDFDALAAQLLSLNSQAQKRQGNIRRVFFAPDLQPKLFAAKGGSAVRSSITFNKRQSWVRHDDHIHIDFYFPCSNGL